MAAWRHGSIRISQANASALFPAIGFHAHSSLNVWSVNIEKEVKPLWFHLFNHIE